MEGRNADVAATSADADWSWRGKMMGELETMQRRAGIS